MALKFAKIEPVTFGDFESMPKVTEELKLRLLEIKGLGGKEGFDEGKKVVSQCFGDDADKVRQFMDENFTFYSLGYLITYLLGGPEALVDYGQVMRSNLSEATGVKVESNV